MNYREKERKGKGEKTRVSVGCGTTSRGLIQIHMRNLQKVGAERISKEIMVKNFPNLKKTVNLQFWVAQQKISTKNIKKTASWHIIIKL